MPLTRRLQPLRRVRLHRQLLFRHVSGPVRASLAIAGVIGIALAVGHALPFSGESSEWAEYLTLGGVTPLAVVCLSWRAVPRWVATALAFIGTVAAVGYVAWSGRWIAAPVAVAQVLLAAAVAGRRPTLCELVVVAFAWAAV